MPSLARSSGVVGTSSFGEMCEHWCGGFMSMGSVSGRLVGVAIEAFIQEQEGCHRANLLQRFDDDDNPGYDHVWKGRMETIEQRS